MTPIKHNGKTLIATLATGCVALALLWPGWRSELQAQIYLEPIPLSNGTRDCACNCVEQGNSRSAVVTYTTQSDEFDCKKANGEACTYIFSNDGASSFDGKLMMCKRNTIATGPPPQ
jgi:hypothetical protein